QSFTVPATAPGSRYLLVVTDAGNQTAESDEGNNVKALPLTLAPSDTDLVVTSASAPLFALTGDVVQVSFAVQNQGTNAAPGLWYDSIYLSDTPARDASSTLITTLQRPGATALAGRADYSVDNVTFAVPQDA